MSFFHILLVKIVKKILEKKLTKKYLANSDETMRKKTPEPSSVSLEICHEYLGIVQYASLIAFEATTTYEMDPDTLVT